MKGFEFPGSEGGFSLGFHFMIPSFLLTSRRQAMKMQ
ncbi:hypothetical protein E1A91_D10G244700v1 [Gossypium mustelinum]|uniref:Uncharacterized protein n=1 Tax=Gossypium mustelinum TaxID=34275 RepID=A0A5D2TE13_GOSMU|nr:hypothetical protein E1A91_D10G244700v1 [Gossypium mustelinum]